MLAAVLSELFAPSSRRHDDLPVAPDNPLGFYESRELVSLNEKLLALNHCRWDRPPLLGPDWPQRPIHDLLYDSALRRRFSAYSRDLLWVDKDPRLCITYPAMLHLLLKRVPLAVSLRDPLEVAVSLHARDGFSTSHGLVLWWFYNFLIAPHLLDADLLIGYQSLLVNHAVECHVRASFSRFLGQFGLQVDVDRVSDVLSLKADVGLNRSSLQVDPLRASSELPRELLEVCERAFQRVALSSFSIDVFKEVFSVIPSPVLEMGFRGQFVSLPLSRPPFVWPHNEVEDPQPVSHDQLVAMQQELNAQRLTADALEARLVTMQQSRSWRVTAPIRALLDRLRT